LKKEAVARRIELQMMSLAAETHFEVWEAAQGNTKDSSQRGVAKRFGIDKYVVGSIVSAVECLVNTFLFDCAQNEWASLAQQARNAMAAGRLEHFGFGKSPRLVADKIFLLRIVEQAARLREDHYAMSSFKHVRVQSMWDRIEWVNDTYESTLAIRASNRAAGAMRADEGLPDQKSQNKTIAQQKWDRIQALLSLRMKFKNRT
jgi:hypothetical protein